MESIEMDVYEIKIKLYLLKDIKIEETQTYLAYFIDSVMVKDNMFLGIHETNQYKFYTFDSLYPLAKNGVYQKDNSYVFRIRTLDYQLAQYLYDTLAKNRTKEFQGLTAEVKIIKPKLIKKIYTLTPVILKTEQGYWKNSIKTEDFEKRLKINLIKKYKDITGEEINEDFQLYYQINFKNKVPVSRKYKINLQPCAYLHNYRKKEYDDLVDLCYEYYLDKAPVFTRGDTKKLAMFIARYVKKGNPDVMYHIDSGKIKPSKSLQDSLTNMLKGKPEFTLLDEQKVTYEKALAIAKENSARKQVYIIHGGPGTGKTVIAVNMLVELINRDKNTIYVTKNSAPREVYQKKLTDGGYKKVYINNLFKGSGVFINANENDFDCIIVDESHRLNAKSGMYQNNGENQIKEIINAAKFSIFFVDDHQIVTTSDIGSSKEIKKWCKYYNAIVYEDKLTSQFRCNGSDAYLSWVDNVLEIEDTANDELDIDYDVRIFDDPLALKKAIFEKNKIANKSRMLAGYCWKWQKNGRNRSDVHDIEIGDFSMSWNFASTKTWAIDEESINEVGCIHTSQGLEFDYVGVIIGDDLRYENGKIITDFFKRAPTDRSIRGLKGQYKNDKESALKLADEIIKNTYRTLLTRGQKGCYIYCTNKELNEYLKLKLKRGKENVRKS